MMKTAASRQVVVVAAVVVVLVIMCAAAPGTAEAACDALQLTPCAGAIIGNAAPTAGCCSRMREQQPCMCTYARDPNLQRYVNSPNGKKVLAACKLPVPSC